MDSALHIVAACSDRKRGAPIAAHRLRAHAHGAQRAAHWLRALGTGGERQSVADLYVGDHWHVARAIAPEAIARGWARAPLWAASAGAGLVPSERWLAPYSATFGRTHADSVIDVRSTVSPQAQARRWWRELTDKGSFSFALMTTNDPDASVLVVASPSYVEALTDDLAAAIAASRKPERFVIVTSQGLRTRVLEEHVVESAANMRGELGGALTSLHARLARHLVKRLGARDWNIANARELATELAATSRVDEVPDRTPVADDEVRSFVRRMLRDADRPSASAFLRAFRASGKACEQKRFRALYESVTSS